MKHYFVFGLNVIFALFMLMVLSPPALSNSYTYSPSDYVCGSRNNNEIRAKVHNLTESQITFRVAAISRYSACNTNDNAEKFTNNGTVYLFRGIPSTFNPDLLGSKSFNTNNSYIDLSYSLAISQKTDFYLAVPCQHFEGYCYTDPITITPQSPTTGELRVRILPTEAIQDGARWRLQNYSSWQTSDSLLTQIPAGSYTLEYNDINNWITPSDQNISIEKGQTQLEEGVYKSNKKFSIAGQITQDGNGINNVTVSFSNYSATTNSNGNYHISNINPNTSGQIRPSKIGYSFNPVYRYIAPINADRTSLNFTANQDNAQIQVDPINLEFSKTNLGKDSSPQTFQINSVGALPLQISSLTVPDGFKVSGFTSGSIASGQSKTVTVTFSPTEVKDYDAKIIINSNAANNGGKTITVKGSGTANTTFAGNSYLLGNPNRHSPASATAGFGVNAVTGNFFYKDIDVSIPGKDFDFTFVRAYNSMSDGKDSFGNILPEPLGRGWTHTYNILLRIKDSQAEIIWGDSSRDGFVKSGTNWIAATPNNRYQMKANGNGWIISSLKNNAYHFNTSGRLTQITSRHNNTLKFTYTDDQLTQITDTAERKIGLAYTGSLLKQLTLPIGNIRYSYTANNQLKIVTDRANNNWRYVYQDKQLRVIHRANTSDSNAGNRNYLLKISYDEQGRVKQQDTEHTATTNGVGTYSFAWSDGVMTYNSPTGNSAQYQWDDQLRLTQILPINSATGTAPLKRKYNGAGIHSWLPEQLQDRKGRKQSLSFDEFDLESFTDTAGRTHTLNYYNNHNLENWAAPNGLTTSINWHNKSPSALRYSGDGLKEDIKVTTTFDASGVLKYLAKGTLVLRTLQSDKDGQPLSISITHKTGSTSYVGLGTLTNTYDVMGRLLTRHNTLTNRFTCLSYDLNGNPTHIVKGIVSCPADLKSVKATAEISHVHMVYDDNNRLERRIVAYNSNQAQTYSQTYDSVTGQVSKACHGAGGDERCETYRYTNDLDLYEITEIKTGRKQRSHTLQSGYLRTIHQNAGETDNRIERRLMDAGGNLSVLSSCTNMESGQANNPHADCADHQERLRIGYDKLDRPISIRTQLGNSKYRTVSISYSTDGRTVTIKQPEGNQTIRESDVLGRLIRVTQQHNGQVLTSRYEYDDNDKLVKITDPSGKTTQFTYDALGRRLSREDLSGKETWEYPDGLTTLHKEPDGTTVTYKRDVAGNVVHVSTSDGFTVDYTYNVLGQKTAARWSGYGSNGERTYSYTPFGELERVTSPSGETVSYRYDDAGRLDRKSYAGLTFNYAYNGLDQLKTLSGSAGDFTFYYDAFTGALLKQVFPNGVETTFERNLAGELTRLSSTKGSNAFLSYGLTLDGNGRHSTIQAEQPQALQQIGEELNFTFTSKGLIDQLNGNSVGYDDRGNILSVPEPFNHSYTYDAFNRVQTHNDTQHKYDDSRRRIAKTRNGKTQNYLWDVSTTFDDVVAEYEGDKLQRRYVHGPGGLLAQIDADDTKHYVHQDFNHNVVALTNASGSVTDGFAWSPYGRAAGRSGTTDIPFGFAGGVGVMTDSADSIYMRARHYHSGLRQFTSPDLIEGNLLRPQSLNRYAYVEGMALTGIDPSGLEFSWGQFGRGVGTCALGAGQVVIGVVGMAAPEAATSIGGIFVFKSGIMTAGYGLTQTISAFSGDKDAHDRLNRISGVVNTSTSPGGAAIQIGTLITHQSEESLITVSDYYQLSKSVVGITSVSKNPSNVDRAAFILDVHGVYDNANILCSMFDLGCDGVDGGKEIGTPVGIKYISNEDGFCELQDDYELLNGSSLKPSYLKNMPAGIK